MSEDSPQRYGGVLAAPPRPGWRTVLDVIGFLTSSRRLCWRRSFSRITGPPGGCQTLTPPAGSQSVWAVAFSPDGRTLTLGEADGVVVLRDATTWRPAGTLTAPGGGGTDSVAFSPDGRMLAFGTANRRVEVWDVAAGRLIATLTAPEGGAVNGVAFSPDSRTLAFGDNSDHAYLCPVSD